MISGVSTERIELPLRERFKTAVRETSHIEVLQVRIETASGEVGVGFGTATPAITGDTLERMESHVHSVLRAHTMGLSTADALSAVQTFVSLSPSGTAAFDMALHQLLSPSRESVRVHTSVTISASSAQDMAAAARLRVHAGFDVLKLKLGVDPDGDVARLTAVHAAVDGRATIWVDANQGWTREQTLQIIDRAIALDVAPTMLEQPVHADAIDDLAFIASKVPMPVTADESAKTLRDIERIAAAGGIDAINVKLMKFGGLTGALAAATHAHAHGLGVLVGSMMEHPASVAVAAQFAATLPGAAVHDLDAAWWMASPEPCRYEGSSVEA